MERKGVTDDDEALSLKEASACEHRSFHFFKRDTPLKRCRPERLRVASAIGIANRRKPLIAAIRVTPKEKVEHTQKPTKKFPYFVAL
jgi:hypothetical protein